MRMNDSLIFTLSKQTTLTLPLMLILEVEVQKMPKAFNRPCEETIPAVRAAGKAGGTTIVMISRLLKMISLRLACKSKRIIKIGYKTSY